MKVGEMKELAKNASQEVLLNAFCEAYKKVQRGKKEELDAILIPLFQGTVEKKQRTAKLVLETVDDLEALVKDFVSKATHNYFYFENDVVPKAERPKWRFAVQTALKFMDAFPRVAECYITLYQVLSHGHIEHMFSGDMPFRSIGVPQETFLANMVRANLAVDDSPKMLSRLIETVCRGYPSPDIASNWLRRQLLPFLDTPERRETALEQARALSETYRRRTENHSPYRSYEIEEMEDRNAAEALSNLVLQISLAVSQDSSLNNLDFYFSQADARDPEITLYRILEGIHSEITHAKNGADTSGWKQTWVLGYEYGLRHGIQPREELQKLYQEYKG